MEIPNAITVAGLADMMQIGSIDLIKQLMRLGHMYTINDVLEFELAADTGYSCIEWVIDSDGIEINPLFSVSKRKTIESMSERYNVSIPAVCHDQLMDIPLHSQDDNTAKLAATILHKTMEACESLGIQFIEIPLVGNSALSDNADHQKLIRQ